MPVLRLQFLAHAQVPIEKVRELRRLHSGRRTTQVLEDRSIEILIDNTVALKHDPAFIFLSCITIRQFRVLLYADTKEVAHMDIMTKPLRLCSHFIPFTRLFLYPNPFIS